MTTTPAAVGTWKLELQVEIGHYSLHKEKEATFSFNTNHSFPSSLLAPLRFLPLVWGNNISAVCDKVP
ncbi:hypothetical protein GQ457_11G032810 [Hibiscus cannabinus]